MKRSFFAALLVCVCVGAGASVGGSASASASTSTTAPTVYTSVADVHACAPIDGGYLAGTGGGLAKVSATGHVERVWTALDGLPETRVHAVFVDGASTWIGTEKGFASVQITGNDLHVVHAYASPPVRAFANHAGALWLATWGGGVMRLDAGAAAPVSVPFDADLGAVQTRVTSLAAFDGSLVAGTAGAGAVRLVAGKFKAIASGSGIPETVWALATDKDRLWIGGLEGSATLGKSGPAKPEGSTDVRAFAASDDALLAASFGRGVLRVGRGNAHLEAVPMAGAVASGRFVQAIGARGASRCVGTQSGLLIGTSSPAGAIAWQKVAYESVPDNDVTAIAKDGDKIYVGTYDKGVAVLESGSWHRVVGADERVNALAIEPRASGPSRLWVATARGLTSIDASGTRHFGGGGALPSSTVHAVTALSSGGILVGTERGAAVVREGAITLIDEKQGVPLRAVWAVAEGPHGKLLLGTSAGLYVGKNGEGWTRVSMATGHLKDDWVTALAVRGDAVYVGTYNGGVSRIDWSAQGFVAGDHFGGGYVNTAGLIVDKDTIYASTMDGLVTRSTGKLGTWKTMTTAAPGRDVTGIVATDGGYWVASRRGIARMSLAI